MFNSNDFHPFIFDTVSLCSNWRLLLLLATMEREWKWVRDDDVVTAAVAYLHPQSFRVGTLLSAPLMCSANNNNHTSCLRWVRRHLAFRWISRPQTTEPVWRFHVAIVSCVWVRDVGHSDRPHDNFTAMKWNREKRRKSYDRKTQHACEINQQMKIHFSVDENNSERGLEPTIYSSSLLLFLLLRFVSFKPLGTRFTFDKQTNDTEKKTHKNE